MHNPSASFLIDRVTEYKNNPQLFETKARYFTQKYANATNLNNGISSNEKDWDFSINKYFIQFINLIDQTLGNNKISIDIGENKGINEPIELNFIINGGEEKDERKENKKEKKEILIKCNKKDLTEDVIKRFKKIIKRENDNDILFIFGLKRLIPDITIGENGLKNNLYITVISDYKCS